MHHAIARDVAELIKSFNLVTIGSISIAQNHSLKIHELISTPSNPNYKSPTTHFSQIKTWKLSLKIYLTLPFSSTSLSLKMAHFTFSIFILH